MRNEFKIDTRFLVRAIISYLLIAPSMLLWIPIALIIPPFSLLMFILPIHILYRLVATALVSNKDKLQHHKEELIECLKAIVGITCLPIIFFNHFVFEEE